MPLSVFISSRRTAARTGSLNSGGVIGIFCNSKISISATSIYCPLSGNCFIRQTERERQSKQGRLPFECGRLSPPLENRRISRGRACFHSALEMIFGAHIYSHRFFCASLFSVLAYTGESKFLDLTAI